MGSAINSPAEPVEVAPGEPGEVRVDGRTTRWAGQRERRRAEFVQAAVDVIGRDGPHAHVAAIAAQAGVARTVIYRHFADRADLDRAIADRFADDLLADLGPRLAVHTPAGTAPSAADVSATVVGALSGYLDYVRGHPHLARFVRTHEASTGAMQTRRVRSSLAGRIGIILSPLVEAGQGLPPAGAGLVAAGLVGLADAALTRWLEDPAGLDRAVVVDTIAAMARGAAEAIGAAGQPVAPPG